MFSGTEKKAQSGVGYDCHFPTTTFFTYCEYFETAENQRKETEMF